MLVRFSFLSFCFMDTGHFMSSGTKGEFPFICMTADRHHRNRVYRTLCPPSAEAMAVSWLLGTPSVCSCSNISSPWAGEGLLHQKPWLEKISPMNPVLYITRPWFPQLIRTQGKKCWDLGFFNTMDLWACSLKLRPCLCIPVCLTSIVREKYLSIMTYLYPIFPKSQMWK